MKPLTGMTLGELLEAFEGNPQSPEINYAIGRKLMALEKYKVAIEYFQTSIALKPKFPEAYLALSELFDKAGDAAAAAHFRSAADKLFLEAEAARSAAQPPPAPLPAVDTDEPAPPRELDTADPERSPARRWYYRFAGGEFGPFTIDEMRAIAESGDIHPQTQVWRMGMPNWRTAGDTGEINAILGGAKRIQVPEYVEHAQRPAPEPPAPVSSPESAAPEPLSVIEPPAPEPAHVSVQQLEIKTPPAPEIPIPEPAPAPEPPVEPEPVEPVPAPETETIDIAAAPFEEPEYIPEPEPEPEPALIPDEKPVTEPQYMPEPLPEPPPAPLAELAADIPDITFEDLLPKPRKERKRKPPEPRKERAPREKRVKPEKPKPAPREKPEPKPRAPRKRPGFVRRALNAAFMLAAIAAVAMIVLQARDWYEARHATPPPPPQNAVKAYVNALHTKNSKALEAALSRNSMEASADGPYAAVDFVARAAASPDMRFQVLDVRQQGGQAIVRGVLKSPGEPDITMEFLLFLEGRSWKIHEINEKIQGALSF